MKTKTNVFLMLMACSLLTSCSEEVSTQDQLPDEGMSSIVTHPAPSPIVESPIPQTVPEAASNIGLDEGSTQALLDSSVDDKDRCMKDVLPVVVQLTDERLKGVSQKELYAISASISKTLNEGSLEKEKKLFEFFTTSTNAALKAQEVDFNNEQFNQSYLLEALNRCLELQNTLNDLSE